jgi:DNA-binding NarL/FixJ family response regulator
VNESSIREPVRVLLADDQRLVRESLATLLGLLGDIELVATASDGEEALALSARHRPDVVLMDLRMPRMRGYLTKDASSDDIHTAILTVAAGSAALDPAVQNHVVAALSGDGRRTGPGAPATQNLPDDLTPREAEVLALIAEGLTNAEIAERLFVSPTTIKSHINHLFAKAGLRDRTQAVNYAYRTGIATPPR